MVGADEAGRQARLVELQHRLYRRDATPADLEQYMRLRDELAAAAPPVEPPRHPADPARRRRRPTLIAGALLGAVALCAAVALLQTRPTASRPVAVPTRVAEQPSESPQRQDRGTQVSARFTDDAAANPTGTTVEVTVDGTRVLAQRYSGSGPAVVPLVTGGAPLDGGFLTVTLRSSSPKAVSWQADGGAEQPASTRSGTPGTPAGGTGEAEQTTVRYPGAPTPRIIVQAPQGLGWTLIVAFSR